MSSKRLPKLRLPLTSQHKSPVQRKAKHSKKQPLSAQRGTSNHKMSDRVQPFQEKVDLQRVSSTQQNFVLPLRERMRAFCEPEVNFVLKEDLTNHNFSSLNLKIRSVQQEDETILELLSLI